LGHSSLCFFPLRLPASSSSPSPRYPSFATYHLSFSIRFCRVEFFRVRKRPNSDDDTPSDLCWSPHFAANNTTKRPPTYPMIRKPTRATSLQAIIGQPRMRTGRKGQGTAFPNISRFPMQIQPRRHLARRSTLIDGRSDNRLISQEKQGFNGGRFGISQFASHFRSKTPVRWTFAKPDTASQSCVTMDPF
jgi:hypothetical protein